jgi:hypothetical protein
MIPLPFTLQIRAQGSQGMPASTIAVQAGQGSRWKCHSEDGTCWEPLGLNCDPSAMQIDNPFDDVKAEAG